MSFHCSTLPGKGKLHISRRHRQHHQRQDSVFATAAGPSHRQSLSAQLSSRQNPRALPAARQNAQKHDRIVVPKAVSEQLVIGTLAGEGQQGRSKIAGKTAVITGGSQGVGQALAELYAKKGFNVVVVARQPDRLQQVVDACDAIRDGKKVCTAIPADVGDPAEAKRAADIVSSKYESVDLLVCNAGVCATGSFLSVPEGECERVMSTNFFGTYHFLKAFLPSMVEAAKDPSRTTKPAVAVVNSFAAKTPLPNMSIYTASKYAIQGLVDALRVEVKQYGIHVAQIHPGLIKSAFLERATWYDEDAAKSRSTVQQAFESGSAIVQTPEEVAAAVVDAVENKKDEVIVGAIFNAALKAYGLTGFNMFAIGK